MLNHKRTKALVLFVALALASAPLPPPFPLRVYYGEFPELNRDPKLHTVGPVVD